MNAKHFLSGLAVLVLASLLIRFGGVFGPAVAGHEHIAPAAPTVGHQAPINRVVSHVAEQGLVSLVGPAVPRVDHGAVVAGLMARLGRCDENQRQAEIQKFVTECDVAELEGMLDDGTLTETLPEDLAQAMLRRLAREDGPWIGDFLQGMPAGVFRGELLGTAMVEWGKNDLPAALEWAQNLKESSLHETALVHLSYRWFEVNPEEALAYAALNPTEHRQLLTTLVGQWSRQQPEVAAAWA
ncbi:MAG: hypothetical protein HYZ36_03290, partial [Pedosphaera parvula]|nr:hypothetical protein [Pedosphaera parvula]